MKLQDAYWIVDVSGDIRTVEALGEAVYRSIYRTEEAAQAALDDLDWDDDWGNAPSLCVTEIDGQHAAGMISDGARVRA